MSKSTNEALRHAGSTTPAAMKEEDIRKLPATEVKIEALSMFPRFAFDQVRHPLPKYLHLEIISNALSITKDPSCAQRGLEFCVVQPILIDCLCK